MLTTANDHFKALRQSAIQAIDLREIIASDLGLPSRKGILESLCPFHAERSPSFRVWQDHYYCFGCHEKGNVFNWLQSSYGGAYDQKGAYRRALELAGITNTGTTTKTFKSIPQNKVFVPATTEPWMQPIIEKSHQALLEPQSKAARTAFEYLQRRALDSIVTTMRFGVMEWHLIQESLELGAPKRIKTWYGRIVMPFIQGQQTVWFKVRYQGFESKCELKQKNILRYDGPTVGDCILPAPYHASSLEHPGAVILIEGELNAAALVVALGDKYPIIGLPGGRLPMGWETNLESRDCIIITDHDKAGEHHQKDLSERLERKGIKARRLSINQPNQNLDANDILIIHGADNLKKRIQTIQ